MKQFAVIGLGRFGSTVAKTLSEKKHQVMAIDSNDNVVQNISDFVTQAVCLDATDQKALKGVGIENVDTVICAIGGDLKASILTVLNLKELGVKEIICKAIDEKHKSLLERLGVTRVIQPEWEMGVRVANSLITSQMMEYVELSDESSIAELVPPENFTGRSLKEINMMAKYGLNIIGIKRKETAVQDGKEILTERIHTAPKADDIIKNGDILIAIGSNEDIENFKKRHK